MDQLFTLFAIVVVLSAALSAIAIHAPLHVVTRSGAVALAVGLMGAGYVAMADLLSRPKPVSVEWAKAGVAEAEVVAARMREGEAIFLWLEFAGEPEPRAYMMPWDQKTARQLHQAMREAEQNGTGTRMTRPFDPDPRRADRQFYAPPQPELPPKLAQNR